MTTPERDLLVALFEFLGERTLDAFADVGVCQSKPGDPFFDVILKEHDVDRQEMQLLCFPADLPENLRLPVARLAAGLLTKLEKEATVILGAGSTAEDRLAWKQNEIGG